MAHDLKQHPEGVDAVCYALRRAHMKWVPYLQRLMEDRQLPRPSWLWPRWSEKHHFKKIREPVWKYLFEFATFHLSSLAGPYRATYKETDSLMVGGIHVALLQHYDDQTLRASDHYLVRYMRLFRSLASVIPGPPPRLLPPVVQPAVPDVALTQLQATVTGLEKDLKEMTTRMSKWYQQYCGQRLRSENLQDRVRQLEEELRTLRERPHQSSSSSSRVHRSRSPGARRTVNVFQS